MVLRSEMKGFRFQPTDQELIEDYLNPKIIDDDTSVHETINEINICMFDPWELSWHSKIPSQDKVWHFFSPRDTKYSNGKRANRKTESGYWKVTGRDRSIKEKKNQEVVGTKKTLVFYKRRGPNHIKTAWVMHEYHTSAVPLDKGVYVLCKVMDKSKSETTISSGGGAKPSHPLPYISEDHVTTEEIFETNVQAEETPNSSVCNFDGHENDLYLRWDELDEGSSMFDSMPPIDPNLLDGFLLSELSFPLGDVEVANQPMSQFTNSVLANHEKGSSESVHTLLHGQMQSNLNTQSFPDNDIYIDTETVSSWMNQYSPRAFDGEYSFNTQ